MKQADTRAERIDPALGWGVAEGSQVLREFPRLRHIQHLKRKHGIDYDSHASYRWVEG